MGRVIFLVIFLSVQLLPLKFNLGSAQEKTMHIKIDIGGKEFFATLNDSEASRDFASMMPLTLQLEDYAGAEKISDLPARLSTAGSPDGSSAVKGDLCLYAPWGNLALFYKSQRYAPGLIKLGQLDNPARFPFNEKTLSATFEKADQGL